MRRMTLFAACVALLAAFAAVSVASAAAAEPALYECAKVAKNAQKKYEGHYTGKHCGASEKATEKQIEEGKVNKYELKEGIGKGKAFKGKGKGANLEVKTVGGIACTSSSDTGKFSSPTTGSDIVATFKGCEFNGDKCQSGSTAGEIITNPLKGVVGYLSGKGTPTPKVGVEITAETGEVLGSFDCTGASFTDDFAVTGGVIGVVTPVNEFTKEATFFFEEKGVGQQEYKKFETGPEIDLTTHVCEEAGCNAITEGFTDESAEETTVVNKGEELELKA